jgi:DNA-binding NtrC family response regulator
VDSAVEAMRAGAADYITKPFEEDRIVLTIERTLSVSRVMAENRDLKQELQQAAGDREIVYVSEGMARVMDLAARVGRSESAVLISGESGTGKELLARYIHHMSARKKARFVPVNCAAISPNLIESELFGHEKGAFTGAVRRAAGKFEYASGGTLFLDEIGDLSLEAQAKLLRALQEKRIQRVGGNEELPVDVRVVCATNQDLQDLVKNGTFRKDLFFRINVFPIHPPPLRERRDDVVPLARHFLTRMVGADQVRLTEGAERVLCEYAWPGNVRELENVMERALILAGGDAITAHTLSFLKAELSGEPQDPNFSLPSAGISLEEMERDLVRQALESAQNNQTAAARLLGLTRAKFRVLLRRATGDPES